VLLYGGDGNGNRKMWTGAILVLAGTVGYSMGGRKRVTTSPSKVVAVRNGNDGKEKNE
jgi:UDP-xylose/UDP-N-acetylglucosamine transporter B4